MYNKIIYSLFTIFLTPTLLHGMEERTLVAAAAEQNTEAVDWKKAFQKKLYKYKEITVTNDTNKFVDVIVDEQVGPTKEGPWTLQQRTLGSCTSTLKIFLTVGIHKNPDKTSAEKKYVYIQEKSLRFKITPKNYFGICFPTRTSPFVDIHANYTYLLKEENKNVVLDINPY